MIRSGDQVRVYRLDDPEQTAMGIVWAISDTQTAIVVEFHYRPPFAVAERPGSSNHGEGLMGFQRAADGIWRERFGGGHFNIEACFERNN